MGMPADHLLVDGLQDLAQIEVSTAFVNAGQEQHLKQKIPQLMADFLR